MRCIFIDHSSASVSAALVDETIPTIGLRATPMSLKALISLSVLMMVWTRTDAKNVPAEKKARFRAFLLLI